MQTSDAQYDLGIALVRSRNYQGAIDAFRKAGELDPSNADAIDNLAITQQIEAYLNRTRGQEDAGIENDDTAADATAMDLAAGQGQTMRVTGSSTLSEDAAAQWMDQVRTQPADFLKSRFAIEDAATASVRSR